MALGQRRRRQGDGPAASPRSGRRAKPRSPGSPGIMPARPRGSSLVSFVPNVLRSIMSTNFRTRPWSSVVWFAIPAVASLTAVGSPSQGEPIRCRGTSPRRPSLRSQRRHQAVGGPAEAARTGLQSGSSGPSGLPQRAAGTLSTWPSRAAEITPWQGRRCTPVVSFRTPQECGIVPYPSFWFCDHQPGKSPSRSRRTSR